MKDLVSRGDLLFWHMKPDPEGWNVRTRELDLDGFLREPIHIIGNKTFTVKQLINYVANVGGGVHHGKPRRKDNAVEIHDAALTIWVDGNPFPLAALGPIATVVVKALRPLCVQLRA
jgi:hypothetical protein